MPSRSQKHMREYHSHYDSDAAGNAKPRFLTTIADKADVAGSVTANTAAVFAGRPRAYSATGLPTGVTIHDTTGVMSGTAVAGVYAACVVRVANTYGFALSNTFTWTIT